MKSFLQPLAALLEQKRYWRLIRSDDSLYWELQEVFAPAFPNITVFEAPDREGAIDYCYTILGVNVNLIK